jgi:hypothetical protein
MKYQEIFTLTRPNTSVPFHPSNSVFYSQSESDWSTTPIRQHFVNTYINTGKCEAINDSVSLSGDGLVLTYTTVFLSEEAITELYSDPYIQNDLATRIEYCDTNGIVMSTDLSPVI